MENILPTSRCTVQRHTGAFCDAPSAEDMPFPICARHAVKLYARMREMVETANGTPIVPRGKQAIQTRPNQRIYKDVVYYVLIGDLIKIGYTANFQVRMRDYPPGKRVLATEAGSLSLERKRHEQFASLRRYGNEWYQPGAALVEHINQLRARQGRPPVLDLQARHA